MTTDKTNNDCIYEKIERYYIDNYEGQNDDGKYRGKPGRAIIKEAIEKYQPSAPAVKGVDELEAQLNQAQNNAEIWTAIWAIYDYLKQTPVASDEDGCEITPSYYKDEHGDIIIPSRDKPSYNSQPKEVDTRDYDLTSDIESAEEYNDRMR